MNATLSCFTCGDAITLGKDTPHALFHSKHEPLCHDCGEGIQIGAIELRENGITGECLADVPDNQPLLKAATPK